MENKFSNEPNLPRAELFKDFVEMKIDTLRESMELVEQGIISERRRIEEIRLNLKRGEFESEHEFDSYCDVLNDDLFQTAEIENILKLLMAVRMVIIVEIMTKRILLWTLNNESEDKRNKFLEDMSYRKRLQTQMNKMGINLEDLADFPTMDELRCLCNAIKHGGLVDEALSRFVTWSVDKGKEINATKIDLNRYYEAIPKYIFDFTNKVKDYLISIHEEK